MTACASCGRPLGFSDRIERHDLCGDCRTRIAAEYAVTLAAYQSTLASLSDPSVELAPVVARLSTLEDDVDLSLPQRAAERSKAVVSVVRAAIADSMMTPEEEDRIEAVGRELGLNSGDVISADPALVTDVLIARANSGHLQPYPDPGIILKPRETAYLALPAELLKEVVDHEYQGGYRGISFRVAKGVRVNAGGFRGHSVVTGSHIEVAASGRLVVTSSRIVFVGDRSTMEIAYPKLVAIDGFSDGVRFSASNRVKAPLFRVLSGELVVATVNAAMARRG